MKQKNSLVATFFIVKLLLLVLSVSFAMASERFSPFPGLSEVSSPDGRYLLRNVDVEEGGGYNHKLFLRDTKTNTEREIYSYDRRVDALWSKDGKGLIINDHGGSDYTDCIVFQFNKEIEKYNVTVLLRSRAIKYKKSIVGNHHVYIEGEKWITNKRIKVRITGYGEVDPDGFSMWYEYAVGGKFKFIAKELQQSPVP
ncbi:MAG: hypothetical protein L0Z48_04945 [candidate division Zixibacteria bacterium]|nr:hypothetical protein [candidate division Zixibacteria bacterium]